MLIHDDCMKITRDLPDGSVDLIVTDPPYRVTPHGSNGSTGGMFKSAQYKKGLIFEHNNVKPKEYAPEFFRVLKDGAHCYVMTNNLNLMDMLSAFTDAGFHFIKSLIWEKGNKIMGGWYMNCFEYILLFRKGKAVRINFCGTPDLLHIPQKKQKDSEGKNLHDTEKPVELMEVLVKNSSQEGDTVLDPFCGIGATGVACEKLGRKFIGIEIDEKYYEIAKERLKN